MFTRRTLFKALGALVAAPVLDRIAPRDLELVGLRAQHDFYDHILTEWYRPIVLQAFETSSALWKKMPPRMDKVEGKYIVFPVTHGRKQHGLD